MNLELLTYAMIYGGDVIAPLKNIELFCKFKFSEVINTIEWENGEDLAPEYLYSKI